MISKVKVKRDCYTYFVAVLKNVLFDFTRVNPCKIILHIPIEIFSQMTDSRDCMNIYRVTKYAESVITSGPTLI